MLHFVAAVALAALAFAPAHGPHTALASGGASLHIASAAATRPPAAAPSESAGPVGGRQAAETRDPGGVGIRLVDIPAATQDDPRARSYIVDNLPPGTTIERRIEVENSTGEPQSVRLYAAAASVQSGSFTGGEGEVQNGLSGWTSVDQPQLELAAGSSERVLVTVAVPADAPEGEQYAAVWAEIRSTATEEAPIVSASRVGIRMYVSVGPGNGPASDFTIDSLTADRGDDGVPSITATVTNTGGRALDVSGSLTLTGGPSGLSAGPFTSGTSTTLAPGDTETLVVPTGADLPDGPWTARLELTSGLVMHEMSAELLFPEAGESTQVEPVAEGMPTALLAGITAGALLLLTAAGVLLLRRRRPHGEVA